MLEYSAHATVKDAMNTAHAARADALKSVLRHLFGRPRATARQARRARLA